MNSCNSKEGKKDSEKEELAEDSPKDKEANETEEAYNDSIQGTFFGVSFGAGREEVIEKFAEKGLRLKTTISTESQLHFDPIHSERYSFGGMSWENLNVSMSNGLFYSIRFYDAFKDKDEAIHSGKSLLSTVSKKYNMTKAEPSDSSTYFLYIGNSREEPRRCVCVYVNRYESISKNIFYGVDLYYVDYEYETEVSDEL